jgi:Domain of unknown function (DUF4350)
MSFGLEPSDRKFLLMAGALLGVLSVVALLSGSPSGGKSAGLASSYSVASDGGKAAYTLLDEMGYRVERWNQSPQDLPGAGGIVLILADPILPASEEESFALLSFVRQGGQVVVTGAAGARMLVTSEFAETGVRTGQWKRFSAEVPSALTANAPEISMEAGSRWSRVPAEALRCYGDRDGATVVQIRLGKGEMIWWADSFPLTNYGLTQDSNLAFFLNSVAPNAGTSELQPGAKSGPHSSRPLPPRVLWDEYFHGDRAGLWSYLGATPVPWFLVQLGIVFAAAVLTYSRRSGPVRALRQESRLSSLEFVETLGDLYWRKGYSAGALQIAYQRFRLLALRRLGLPLSTSSEELFRGIRDQLGWTVPGLWQVLQRSELGAKDSDLSDARSLQLIQELYDYSRRLGLQHS